MKKTIYIHAKTTCPYCGEKFSLSWTYKPEELPVFIQSRRLYETKKSEIVEHQNECMRKRLEEGIK